MENQIINASPVVPGRDIKVVTAEVKELCQQARVTATMYAIEIGRRLVEAKELLPHGAWGKWLEEEVSFSQSTANNFMQLFQEYGGEQISVFGAVSNSETIAKLPYTKALKLLAVPAGEREEFAREVGAESLSVRQLEEAIRERDEAVRARKAAEASVAREIKLAVAEAQNKADAAVLDLKAKVQAAEQKAAEADALSGKVDALQAQLEKARKDAETVGAKAAEKAEKTALAAAKLASKKELDEMAARVQEAKDAESRAIDERTALAKQAEEAKREADRLRAELEAQRKAAAVSDPKVAEFKVLFGRVQADVEKLKGIIAEERDTAPEMADKLAAALRKFGEVLAR